MMLDPGSWSLDAGHWMLNLDEIGYGF